MTLPIIDLHQDLLLHLKHANEFNQKIQTDFDLLERNNIKVTIATCFPHPKEMESKDLFFHSINSQLIEYQNIVNSKKNWLIIKTNQDLELVLNSKDKFGLILHLEGLEHFDDKPEDWLNLNQWFDLGWRSCGLLWVKKNNLGGGNLDQETTLSPIGKKLINWLNQRPMIIDLAHMNIPTFNQVISLINKPPLVSHTGSASIYNTENRNLTDEQLLNIKNKDGLVGLYFSPKFIGNNPFNHLDYLIKLIGKDHLAIGSDFGGLISGTIDNYASVNELPKFIKEIANSYDYQTAKKIAYQNSFKLLNQYLK